MLARIRLPRGNLILFYNVIIIDRDFFYNVFLISFKVEKLSRIDYWFDHWLSISYGIRYVKIYIMYFNLRIWNLFLKFEFLSVENILIINQLQVLIF